MKTSRLTYLFLLLCSVAFISCSKDDDDPAPTGGGGSNTTYDPGKVIIDFSNMANGHGVNLSGRVTGAIPVPNVIRQATASAHAAARA